MKIFSLVLISLTLAIGQAEETYVSPYQAMKTAANVLKKEIARDADILSYKMNIQRLKATRIKLKNGLAEKEKAVKNLKKTGRTDPEVLAVLEKTLRDEKRISKDTRIGQTRTIRAQRILKANLGSKKKALAKAEKWLGK